MERNIKLFLYWLGFAVPVLMMDILRGGAELHGYNQTFRWNATC